MHLFTAAAISAFLAFPGLPVLAQSFEEGVSAAQRGDFATALKHFEPLAEQGDANAQRSLGIMYAYGEGVTQDDVKAVAWYRRAADQGYAAAQ